MEVADCRAMGMKCVLSFPVKASPSDVQKVFSVKSVVAARDGLLH